MPNYPGRSGTACAMPGPGKNPVKKTLLNLLPPATVAVIILFWMLGPKAWINSSWAFVVVGSLTLAFVQAIELVNERHSGWRIDKREFSTDLFYVVLCSTALAWCGTHLADDPMAAAKHALGIHTLWAMHLPFIAQVALVVLIVEFGQYWMHVLMHNSPVWWVHAPHHHITQLNAAKGYVGNPVELFLVGLSVVAFFDLPLPAVFCGLNVLSAVSIYAHANVRSDPPWWYAFFFTTIRNHSLHHTALSYEDTRCNYGNSLILLDRIFGTYREGESELVGQDDRKRLSICEQMIFPATPLIAKYKARRTESEPAAG
jgi:sterol desaturase/sphingolipid hydroxylase (fatty acid hydroxylase superfamily)